MRNALLNLLDPGFSEGELDGLRACVLAEKTKDVVCGELQLFV